MTQQNVIRGLVIYGLVLPLAVILGYLLSNPLHYTTVAAVFLVILVLISPFILRFHHPVLLLAWNMTMVVPVLPGRPQLWLVMTAVSLTVSVVQYAINRRAHFWHHGSVLAPLLFLGAVVLITALLTGGLGMRITGSENIGGKRYLLVFAAILGYVAITAHDIPRERAMVYLGLFLLGSLTNAIGNLLPLVPPALYPIFMIFPAELQGIAAAVSQESVVGHQPGIWRPYGLSVAAIGLAFYLLARQGMHRLLSFRNPALYVCIGAFVLSTLGGFRAFLFLMLMVFGTVFFLEGLHRTRKLPLILVAMALAGSLAVAFVNHLPVAMQRSMSLLPIPVDPAVEADARASTEWRLEMWRDLIAEIPSHLLLGKGLSITAAELDTVTALNRQGRATSAEISKLTGDYHSGPLSVIIPFGIWGVIGWIWFCLAALRVVYMNYRYGDPELKTANTLLFAYFLSKVVMFHLVFGGFYFDLALFAGMVGFSLSLNHGICQPAIEPAREAALHGALSRPRLMPSFSNLPRG